MTAIFFFILGLFLLYIGGDHLVFHATRLARKWNVSSLVIGLILLSLCTSLPEMIVSIIAHLQKGLGDISMGNIIGSNIANIGLVLGSCGLLRPLSFRPSPKRDATAMLLFTVLLSLFMQGGTISRMEGILFLLCIAAYLFYQWRLAGKNRTTVEQPANGPISESNIKLLLKIVIDSALLIWGGELFLDGAIDMAHWLGISERVISLTAVALGTSLPELVTSLFAAYRGEIGLLLGNIIGSNIFNILWILGIAATCRPLSFSAPLLHTDCPLLLVITALLWLGTCFLSKIGRLFSALLFLFYLGYVYFLLYTQRN